MSGITDSVSISISVSNPQPTGPGFGVPLIVGPSSHGGPLVQSFNKLADLVTAGFLATDSEYIAASKMFSQPVAPPVVKVGRRANLPARAILITPHAVAGNVFAGSIEGQAWSVTSSGTLATDVAALVTAINNAIALAPAGGMGEAAADTGNTHTTVTISGAAAGKLWGFGSGDPSVATYEVKNTTADPGIVADLTAIQLYDGAGSSYGLFIPGAGTAEIVAAAAWVETAGMIAVFDDIDTRAINVAIGTDTGSGGSDSAAAKLKHSSYGRSAVMFTAGETTGPIGAAWEGANLPKTAGSENWKFCTLAGVSAYRLTSTQESNLKAKSCNDYTTVGGYAMTAEGTMASGQFIDVVRGIDALAAQLQGDILAAQVNASNLGGKIPFTDKGIAQIESIVRSDLNVRTLPPYNFLAPGSVVVTAPLASEVSGTDKSNRILRNVAFTAKLAGAINDTIVSGVITP
jgi:hypothetical protein